jgi:lipocalin
MKISAIALAALGTVDARIHLFESCPPVTTATNFDAARYAGEWYEVLRDSEFFYEMGQDCVTH